MFKKIFLIEIICVTVDVPYSSWGIGPKFRTYSPASGSLRTVRPHLAGSGVIALPIGLRPGDWDEEWGKLAGFTSFPEGESLCAAYPNNTRLTVYDVPTLGGYACHLYGERRFHGGWLKAQRFLRAPGTKRLPLKYLLDFCFRELNWSVNFHCRVG